MIRAVPLFAVLALVLMAPALILGAPAIDSAMYTHVWTEQFGQALARGELYPRWLPDSFEALGSPSFYFYPPLAFYVSGVLSLAMETRFAVSWAGAVMLFGSGLTMYLWLRGKASEALALAGAALYMAAPYHLTDFYVRATLAEVGAFVWLPLIALGIENQAKRWAPPVLALSYAALVCTHLPVALLTTVLLIPPLVLKAAWRAPLAAVRCAVAGVAGLALSAVYLLPALTLQDHTLMPQIMWKAHFDAANWSVFELFKPGPVDPFLAPMTFMALGWAVVAIAVILRGGRFWPAVILWAVLCSLSLIPLTALPLLDKVQFPWRALIIIEFAAITAAVVWKPRPLWLAPAVLFLFLGAQPFAVAGSIALHQEIDPEHLDRVFDAVEYLPDSYTPVPKGRYPTGLEIYRGPLVQGPAVTLAADAKGVTLKASADGRVTIRKANFPRWRVEGPHGATPVLAGPLVSFKAQAGETYRLTAVRTPPEVIGGWVSLFGVVLTIFLFFPGFARLRSVRDTTGRGA